MFQNPAVFTNDSITPGDPDPAYKWIPSNVNPPQHVQYRQILNHAFGPASVARVEPKARTYCRMAIDEIVDTGRCDYVADVGGVFPTRVFLELVDLPWQDAPLFVAWTETIFDGLFTGPEAMVAFDESRQYFVDLIAERRRAPRDPEHDFASHLLTATIDGQPMPDEDILNIFNQLMLAGLDTVKSALSYSFLHLATHDTDRRRVVDDPVDHPGRDRGVPARLSARHGGSQAQPGHRLPRRCRCAPVRWSCWPCRRSCTTPSSSSGPTT